MNIDIEDYDDIHKIILVGDSNTGKTSLINAFSKQKVPLVPKPTIGVEFTSETVIIDDYKKIKVQFWDTAGQEKYKAITLNHYRQSVGAIVVFDITNRKSYTDVNEWLAAIRERAEPTVQIALIGNKSDLASKRTVTTAEAEKYAENERLIYAETSIKDTESVKEAFTKLVKNVSATRKVELKGIKVRLEDDEKKRLSKGDCPC